MRAEVVVVDVEPGEDSTAAFVAAWSRDARVLPIARSMPCVTKAAILARIQQLRVEPSAGLILATSGSSGVPRLIDLSLEAMRASAELGARVIPFGQGDVWHASLAPTHIGGVMILMRAHVLGGSVRFSSQPRVWSDLEGSTHVSLVAAQLARLLDDPSPIPRSLKAIMLGGGPSAQVLHDAAVSRGLPLYSSYGMTETSSQVATGRRMVGDPATLAGPALAGIEISINERNREILIDGPTLARGEFVDGELVSLSRPFATRDAGFIDELGRLHVIGRLDAMIISGGRNIHPESIERALGELACIRAACVVGVPHAKWGMRPVAFIDFASTPTETLTALLRDRLDSYLIPDAFFVMPPDEAARMKASRAALSERLAAGEKFEVVT